MSGSRSARRALWLMLVCLLVAAAALWGASRLAWSVGATAARGADAVPGLVPLALLALAALDAQFAGGALVKRVIAVLVLCSAAYLVYRLAAGAGTAGPDVADTAGAAVRPDAARSQEPWAIGLVGLAVAAELGAGILLFAHAARLPTMGARYSRRTDPDRKIDPDQRMWQELSEGEDPTSR